MLSACLRFYNAAEARVTTSSHLHNHALAGLDAQAVTRQQQLSIALVSSIQEWAQCSLATTAMRQLVQLELNVPSLTADTKKKVTYALLTLGCKTRCCSLLLIIQCLLVLIRSRIWCKRCPMQRSTLLMLKNSFKVWHRSQALFWNTDRTLKGVSTLWYGLFLNKSKPCSYMAMSGFKTLPTRRWQPIALSLPLLASMATAGMLSHFAYVQSTHVHSITVKSTCCTVCQDPTAGARCAKGRVCSAVTVGPERCQGSVPRPHS